MVCFGLTKTCSVFSFKFSAKQTSDDEDDEDKEEDRGMLLLKGATSVTSLILKD